MHKIVWAWGVGWGGLGLMGWGYIDWKEALTSVRCLMLNPSSSNSQPGPACGQLHPFCSSISTFPLFLTEQGSVRVGVLLQRLNWFLLDNKYFSLTHMWHRFTATVTPLPYPLVYPFHVLTGEAGGVWLFWLDQWVNSLKCTAVPLRWRPALSDYVEPRHHILLSYTSTEGPWPLKEINVQIETIFIPGPGADVPFFFLMKFSIKLNRRCVQL